MKKFLVPVAIAALIFLAACGSSKKESNDSDPTTPDGDAIENPDSGDTAPDTGDTAPDTGDTAPDTGDTAPDTGDSTPDTGDTAPDSGDTAPDSGDTAPDLDGESIQDDPGYDPEEITTIEETENCAELNLSDFAGFTNDNISVAEAADTESKELTITISSTEKVCLKLSGSYDGGIKFKNKKDVDVDLILNAVTITSENFPGYLKLNTSNEAFTADYKNNTYTVQLEGDSTITGAADSSSKKVLGCQANMTVVGSGSLTVTAKYKTGIGVDDVMTIKSGVINVNVERPSEMTWTDKAFAMKITNGFVMDNGKLTIKATDNIDGFEARGLKVDGQDCLLTCEMEETCVGGEVCDATNGSTYGQGKGYIIINGGEINVESDAKAITAGWDIEEDFTNSDASDNPTPDLTINGGKITLKTVGTPRDETATKASLSPEGLEAKNKLVINGGEIRVYSTDDAIQAGNHVEIAGGKIIAYVSQNDAVDSNGTMLLKGGILIAMGATAPEGGIDSDMNSNVTYEGGIMIGIGGSNNSPQTVSAGSFVTTSLSGSSSSQGGPGQGGPGQGGPGQGGGMGGESGSSYAGKTFALTATGSSDAIAAFKLPSDFAGGTSVIIMAPSLVKGTAYQFNADTTLTVAEGSELYDDILLNTKGTISGGTATSVTAGQASNQGGPGGPGGGQQP